MTQNIKKSTLLVGDIILYYASLWAGLSLRRLEFITRDVWVDHFKAFTVILIFTLIVLFINDLYAQEKSSAQSRRLNTIIISMSINVVVAAIFFYLTASNWNIRPQTVLVITTIIFTILLYIWRSLAEILFSSDALKNNILFIGYNSTTKELIEFFKNNIQSGFRVQAILDSTQPPNVGINTYTAQNDSIKNIFNEQTIDTVVISLHQYEQSNIITSLYENLNPNIRIVNLPKFYEEITGKIPVGQIGQAWVIENFTSESKRFYNILKRVIDIAVALILGVVTLILLPFIAVIIVIDSGLPIFFTQVRVGYIGKTFNAIKFRSMKTDAEKNGPEWSKGKNDPRITRVGSVIRKTRLDELPQLWNILRGEMSLIGSRPERPHFVEELVKEIPFYKERLLIKPGLSGWAQVMGPAYGGSKKESLEKLQYDLYYLKNRSLGLDISIALKTIKTILSRKGQ